MRVLALMLLVACSSPAREKPHTTTPAGSAAAPASAPGSGGGGMCVDTGHCEPAINDCVKQCREHPVSGVDCEGECYVTHCAKHPCN